MDELVRWLGQQLDKDERIARAASWTDDANTWHAEPSPYGARDVGQRWYVEDAMGDGVVSHVDPAASDDEGAARHIAEWDPARVLREIDAKRRMLARHAARYSEPAGGIICAHDGHRWPCPDVRDFAAAYADRPGYKESWRP